MNRNVYISLREFRQNYMLSVIYRPTSKGHINYEQMKSRYKKLLEHVIEESDHGKL